MTWSAIDQLIKLPAIIIAALSIICNFYVIISTNRAKGRVLLRHIPNGRYTRDFVLYTLIYWLAVADCFHEVTLLASIGIPWVKKDSSSLECTAAGFLSQIAGVFSCMFKLLIPCFLAHLLICDIAQQNQIIYMRPKQMKCLFRSTRTLIILVSFISAILPLIPFSKHIHYTVLYEYTNPKTGKKYAPKCWVDGYYQLIYYGLLILSIFLDILALGLAMKKYIYNQTKQYTTQYLLLVKRCVAWVAMFLVVGLFPFVDIMYYYFCSSSNSGGGGRDGGKEQTVLWLVLVYNYFQAFGGIGNVIVWYIMNKKMKLRKDRFKFGEGMNSMGFVSNMSSTSDTGALNNRLIMVKDDYDNHDPNARLKNIDSHSPGDTLNSDTATTVETGSTIPTTEMSFEININESANKYKEHISL